MVEVMCFPKIARCSLKKLLLVAVLAIVGAITGCSDAKFPYLLSIQVTPGSPSVAAGLTQQFAAQGTFSNGSTRDLTSLVTWTSSTSSVAKISAGGLASTFTQGTTSITASFTQPGGTVTGSTTLTVGAANLVSIVIGDATAPSGQAVTSDKIAVGTSLQFFAYGHYSDGHQSNLTLSVQWTAVSPNGNVATINAAGTAKGLIPGTASITAKDPTTGLMQSATLAVTNVALTSIAVSPANRTIAPLARLDYLAVGTFSDGTSQDITAVATWASTSTTVATVAGPTATGVSAGSTMIQATLSGVTGSTPLTVSSVSVVAITFPTPAVGMAIGSAGFLAAVGTFSDGTHQRLLTGVTWSVTPSDGSIATVRADGLVTGVAAGTATVKAQVGSVSGTENVNVQNATSIAVMPAAPSIAAGTATQLRATATLADGTAQDVTQYAAWSSANPAVATIASGQNPTGPNIGGLASGIAAGTSTIFAVLGGVSGQASLTVSSATLSSIAITPATPQSISLGSTAQYKATATFSDSTTQDLTSQVMWTSSDPAVAIVDKLGTATSTGVGSTMVMATASVNGATKSDNKALMVF
jgi:hypothetical protein